MIDLRTSESYRLIQVFLSAEGRGIFEAYVSTDSAQVVCTCPGFYYRAFCKHSDYISDVVKATPGHSYNVQVVTEIGAEVMPHDGDAKEFANWMIDHCKVIVL